MLIPKLRFSPDMPSLFQVSKNIKRTTLFPTISAHNYFRYNTVQGLVILLHLMFLRLSELIQIDLQHATAIVCLNFERGIRLEFKNEHKCLLVISILSKVFL